MRINFAKQNLVDVRDMECAQALAQTGQAMKRLEVGAVLEVICNAADVRHDLLVWAKELGHGLVGQEEHPEGTWLRLRKNSSKLEV